ncbi:MAG: hypothetical protein ABIJ09_19700 [Pseudomonadota bacterium]
MARLSIVSIAMVVLAVEPARGYELARAADGTPLEGVVLPVHLQVLVDDALLGDGDGGELGARAAAWRASLRWEQPDSSRAHFTRRTAHDPAPADGGAQVTIRALTEDWPAEYGSPLATVAFTVVQVDEGAGRITAAEVLLNAQGFAFSTSDQPRRLDVEGTVSHELGHALSLEHSCGEAWGTFPDCAQLPDAARAGIEEATMYPAASPGNTWQRDLAEDDVAGLSALYPADPAAIPPVLLPICACSGGTVLLAVDSMPGSSAIEIFRGDDRQVLKLEPATCQAGAALCRRTARLPVLPGQRFDVELTDLDSGKRAVVFDTLCEPCTEDQDPPVETSGCHCGLATGTLVPLPWVWFRRRRPCRR